MWSYFVTPAKSLTFSSTTIKKAIGVYQLGNISQWLALNCTSVNRQVTDQRTYMSTRRSHDNAVTGNITLTHFMLTQFILVQPVTHKRNSLKNWFTKYTTQGANQTKLRTSIVPWSQIHGTGQSKPRTFIVIYVNFLNYQRNAYSSSRHTSQAYNRQHRQQTTIQHMLTHTAHSILPYRAIT